MMKGNAGGVRVERKVGRKPEPEPKTKVFETFREFGSFDISNMKQEAPSCFNGFVRVKRYRVTIEEVEEPAEVICARLQKLWDECKNHHHWLPLQSVAKQYGLELKHR